MIGEPGADRENTTVMAACSASGRFLPPMIIFPGQHVQSTWKPTTLATSENYPWIYANKKGWMDSPPANIRLDEDVLKTS